MVGPRPKKTKKTKIEDQMVGPQPKLKKNQTKETKTQKNITKKNKDLGPEGGEPKAVGLEGGEPKAVFSKVCRCFCFFGFGLFGFVRGPTMGS